MFYEHCNVTTSGKAFMMRLCVKFCFGKQNIHFFSIFNVGNTGKKSGLSVVQRTKIVTLNEEGTQWCGSTRFQLFDSRAKRTVVD